MNFTSTKVTKEPMSYRDLSPISDAHDIQENNPELYKWGLGLLCLGVATANSVGGINQSYTVDISANPDIYKRAHTILDVKNYYQNDENFGFLNMHTEIVTMINKFSKLNFGWDGYTAKPIPNSICEKTTFLMLYLQDRPEVFPTGRETIQLEYDKKSKSLELEIFENKYEILISYADGKDNFLVMDNLFDTIKEINSFNAV